MPRDDWAKYKARDRGRTAEREFREWERSLRTAPVRGLGGVQFPTGKHKGRLVSECPTSYLNWFLRVGVRLDTSQELINEIKAVLESRPQESRRLTRKTVPDGQVPCLLVLGGTQCQVRRSGERWRGYKTTRDCRFFMSQRSNDGRWILFKTGEWEMRVRKHEVQYASCVADELLT